jgi:hypothetical protein
VWDSHLPGEGLQPRARGAGMFTFTSPDIPYGIGRDTDREAQVEEIAAGSPLH